MLGGELLLARHFVLFSIKLSSAPRLVPRSPLRYVISVLFLVSIVVIVVVVDVSVSRDCLSANRRRRCTVAIKVNRKGVQDTCSVTVYKTHDRQRSTTSQLITD